MTTQDSRLLHQQLGQRIAELRRAQHLTQQQFARLLGVAQQTVAHYESGRLGVSAALLPRLANLLGISVADLYTPPSASPEGECGPEPRAAADRPAAPRQDGGPKAVTTLRDALALIEKILSLPPERLAEVDIFVDFLKQRA